MKKLNIVVPDGSMQKPIMQLFAKAGLEIVIEKERTKEGIVNVPWIEKVVFQRPQEIPILIKKGLFDVGIAGEDWLANYGYNFPKILRLPIGRSGYKPVRIVLAVKKDSDFRNIKQLPKKCIIATEYVELTKKFLDKNDRSDIQVNYSYGNTEQKISFGAAAIVDVTESGNSLKENGLEIIDELMESNTVVVATWDAHGDPDKRPCIDCLVGLILGAYQASQYVMLTANVPSKALKAAAKIIGGLKGPSCLPLATTKNWYALQSVVPKENEHDIILKLLKIGVRDIIVQRDIPLIMS